MRKLYSLLCLCLATQWVQAQCPNPISSFPYTQNFESGAAGWTSGGSSGTWVLGTPAKPVINSAASGSNAWVTASLTADYPNSAQSFLQSPCFNFSGLGAPVIELSIWWQSEFSYDGAVLQASTNGGSTWTTIGAMGDSVNWYTDNSISGLTWSGSTEGWSGRNTSSSTTGSGGWKTARHDLTGLANQPSVLLRFAFGSDGSVTGDGIAIDDINIYTKPAFDVKVASLLPLQKPCGLDTAETISVRIRNMGSNPASNFQVSYQIDNGPVTTETFTGTVAPFGSSTYTFAGKANLAAPGSYRFKGYTTWAPDVNTNDTLRTTIFNTLYSLPSSFTDTLDFEAGPGAESIFTLVTRNESRVAVNPDAKRNGQYGFAMYGTNPNNWQPVVFTNANPTVGPWYVGNNPTHFSSASLCINTNRLDSLTMRFSLRQLKGVNYTETNFRVTVNGQPAKMRINGRDTLNISPPITGPALGWQDVTVDLKPYLTGTGNITVSLQSSVSGSFQGSNATANFIDDIVLKGHQIVGKAEDLSSRNLTVYPNPNNGAFMLDLDAAKGTYQMSLTDVTGKVLWQDAATISGRVTKQVNVGNQAKGIYFLRLSNGSRSTVQKVVIF